MRATLQEVQSDKKLRKLDLDVTSMNIFAVILGVARWYRPKGGMDGKQVAKEVSKFIMGAVLK